MKFENTVSNDALDIVRVMAMTGVVADHYLMSTGCTWLFNNGRFLGGVSVAIFLALSAYLFGVKWRAGGCQKLEVLPFLKKRFLRIFIPLWIALIAIIALEVYVQHPFDTKTVVLNFFGLSWAKPFIWAGHLWYVTMCLILYIIFLGVSHIKALRMLPVWCWLVILAFLSVGMMMVPQLFISVSRALIPLTILFAMMVFVEGDRLMEWCLTHRWAVGLMAIGMFLGTWYINFGGLFQVSEVAANVLTFLSGFMLFFAIATIGQGFPRFGWVSWLAGVSYELYLIHPTVMMTLRQFMDGNTAVYYLVSLIMILVCSVALQKICNRINHIFTLKTRC